MSKATDKASALIEDLLNQHDDASELGDEEKKTELSAQIDDAMLALDFYEAFDNYGYILKNCYFEADEILLKAMNIACDNLDAAIKQGAFQHSTIEGKMFCIAASIAWDRFVQIDNKV
jgi:hypothetical protein